MVIRMYSLDYAVWMSSERYVPRQSWRLQNCELRVVEMANEGSTVQNLRELTTVQFGPRETLLRAIPLGSNFSPVARSFSLKLHWAPNGIVSMKCKFLVPSMEPSHVIIAPCLVLPWYECVWRRRIMSSADSFFEVSLPQIELKFLTFHFYWRTYRWCRQVRMRGRLIATKINAWEMAAYNFRCHLHVDKIPSCP